MQTQAKWITGLEKTLLNHWKAMKTVQLTSVKCKYQLWKTSRHSTVIQICCIYKMSQSLYKLSKCWDDEDQMPKIANLPKTANDLGWHSCLAKFHLTKYGLDSLYILF